MNSVSRFFPSRRWLFIPPLALGIVVVGYLASSKKQLTRIDAQENAKPLQVMRVERQNVSSEAIGFGTVKPRRLWAAVAEVGGRIVAAHPSLRSGMAVKQGELLVSIDPTDYRLREKQRGAELGQAKAQLDQMKLTQQADQRSLEIQQDLLELRQREVDRLSELRSRSAASQSEADVAQAALLQQRQTVQTLKNTLSIYPAQITAAEAAVELATARLAEAQREVERTKIVAPFDGLLSGVTLEPDQYIATQQQLFQIYDTESVEIEAQFSLAQLQRVINPNRTSNARQTSVPIDDPQLIAVGGSMADRYTQTNIPDTFDVRDCVAEIIIRSGNVSMQYPGHAVRMTESLDEQTRTLGIVIAVENPTGNQGSGSNVLRPGTYCEVALHSDQTAAVHLVPRTSVNEDSLYVVDAENRLRRRQVQVAFLLRQQVAVVNGLQDGDLVVVFPPAVAMEGELIEPRFDTQPTVPPHTLPSVQSVPTMSDTSSFGAENKK